MELSRAKVGGAIFFGVCSLFTVVAAGKIWENVSASQYVVIQSPVAGDLNWRTTPGVAWQGFGDVTGYNIRMMYDFREKGYAVQFNDGGHGTIYGSIQCELPKATELLTQLHRQFPNQEQVESGLVKTSTEGAIYLVGTLMSSRESYAEKKNDLIHYVTDQVQNGPYRTRQKREWIKDPVTNESKEIITAEIVLDKDGNPMRQEKSTLSRYGLTCFQFIVNKIAYDKAIEDQIKQQQSITMNVQTSVAEKVMAEQRAQTSEATGRANATEAKWKQETIKATETTRADQERQVALIQADREKQVQVTNANRDKEVAETAANRDKAVAETQGAARLAVADFDKRSAEQTKLQQILLGQGEAERKKLVLEADGALQQKLETYVQVSRVYADAMRNSRWVPEIVMGAGNGTANTGAVDLISLLTAKTAKDLSLDLGVAARRPITPMAPPLTMGSK